MRVLVVVSGFLPGLAGGAASVYGGTYHVSLASGQVQGDGGAASRAFGIRWHAVSVAQGAHPTLPNGAPGLTASAAERAASAYTAGALGGSLLPGVQATTQYGIFSDDMLSERLPSGILVPVFQDRPAWIVTFSGPGLIEEPNGPGPDQGQEQVSDRTHHEDNVVIDASTGQFLETYTFR